MADDSRLRLAYPPLLDGEPSIRIATVHRNPDNFQITFTTKVQPLGSFPQDYVALSYTGIVSYEDHPKREYKEVTLNNQSVEISSELHTFLERLSELGRNEPFWCDGLCINQTDLEEKTDQVFRMTHTFYNAKSVWAWLGGGDEQTEKILGFMDQWFHILDVKTALQKGKFDSVLASFALTPEDLDDGVQSLSERIYWTRIWIVQEVYFARDITFFCGSYWTSWTDLHAFIKRLPSGSSPGAVVLGLKEGAGVKRTIGNFVLVELIKNLKDFRATDPRDKLFALHAMSQEFHHKSIAFKPDYTKSREALVWDCLLEAECPHHLWLVAGNGLIKALNLGQQYRSRLNCLTASTRKFHVNVYSHVELRQFCDNCNYGLLREKWGLQSGPRGNDKLSLDRALGVTRQYERPKPRDGLWPYEFMHTAVLLWVSKPTLASATVIKQATHRSGSLGVLYKVATVVDMEIRIPDLLERLDAPDPDLVPSLNALIGATVHIYSKSSVFTVMTSCCELSAAQYAAILDFYSWVWRNLELKGCSEPLIDAFDVIEVHIGVCSGTEF